jgi:hypothetical protein
MKIDRWHVRKINGKDRLCGLVDHGSDYAQDHISAPLVKITEKQAVTEVRTYQLGAPK